jgi:uncharacterized membrane protein YkvA (DUF1232 family)
MLTRLKVWATAIKRDIHALSLAARDPRVSWHAKALALAVAGYALSPVDVIPDFIPVIGYLDDLIIIPLGIRLAISMIPADIMAEHRAVADSIADGPRSRIAAAVIILMWIGGTVLLAWLLVR